MAAGGFVRSQTHGDVLLAGPPGVGKSHLVQAIGHHWSMPGSPCTVPLDLRRPCGTSSTTRPFEGHDRIMTKYLKPDLLILDDMGLKQLPSGVASILFEIIMRRHQLHSIDDDQ